MVHSSMMKLISDTRTQEIRKEVLDRFLRYVQVYTTSDETSASCPSTPQQWDLARMLKEELEELGLSQVELDENGYVYAVLPGGAGSSDSVPPLGLLAHMDTSPDQPGEHVKPRVVESYDGGRVPFPDNADLLLSPANSPELLDYVGEAIVTASGTTLLGADDKAGIAEIMTVLSVLTRDTQLQHPEIRVCFTPDEEIGRGADLVQTEKLAHYCYTLDGGRSGELEEENFDAWKARIQFKGVGTHPGTAKDRMINAAGTAARYLASLPEWYAPEHTEGRDGFIHIHSVNGTMEEAEIVLIIRDFDPANNERILGILRDTASLYEVRHPGLTVSVDAVHQYQNMRFILKDTPELAQLAFRAMQDSGVTPIPKPIRGGTDGARLTYMGHPCPNIFAGGLHFHAKTEWIAVQAMTEACYTVLHIAARWAAGEGPE